MLETAIRTGGSLLPTKNLELTLRGLNLRYAELGDSSNTTVILLHGVPENLHAWYAVAPLLSEQYHVLALDWPGFGDSQPMASTEEVQLPNFLRSGGRVYG